MRRNELQVLRCPIDGEELDFSQREQFDGDDVIEGKVMCSEGHDWTVSEGMPSLVNMGEVPEEDMKLIRDYDEHAEEYDEKIKFYDSFLRIDMMKERQQMLAMIPLEEGAKIVDISIGTALNFVALNNVEPNQIRKVLLHGVDLSKGMLKVARRKLDALGLRSLLVHADVNRRYPFPDNYFDVVVNTGGINTCSDIARAFSEMLRICKPSGMVLVCDEDLSPRQEKTEFGKRVVSQNRLFESKPPLDKVPRDAVDVRHWWIMNETFYVLTFSKMS